MNKDILTVVDVVSNEKGVAKEIIFEAIEAALASATKKRNREDIEVRVSVDRTTGDYETFRRWEIVEDSPDPLEFPARQIRLSDARRQNPDIQIGGFVEEPMASVEFGRIAAQTAKQVIVQKVREAERNQVLEAYRNRVGEMVSGVVKRVERSGVILDLGSNAEALIARDQMIPREAVRPGDRLRAHLREVRAEIRGPQLFLSRTAPELLIELFKIEVPEINDGLIEIISGARDPGSRAKIAVRARDPRIDPIGACVGMRGSRVQAVSNELAGERVDIILWDENPAQFVINAMAPAEVVSIMVDEDAHSMDVAVAEEQLSQAIGRGGQNVKLASELTKWELNIMSVEQADQKNEVESQNLQAMFKEQLDVDDEVASILVQEGFSSIEEVAYVPENEMLKIEEFDQDLVKELRDRARDVMLTRAIVNEERLSDAEPAEDLLRMEGMDEALAYELAGRGVVTMEHLAEQAVDDLMEIEGMDAQRAGALIMTARRPWFEAADAALKGGADA
ncbi:MAG: transcription termination/antitermination protein NusA [Gammaproteobacteria bacterium]|nr:transcription termination/antitermination protein NusA [Gammaproteobacteria bacterium]